MTSFKSTKKLVKAVLDKLNQMPGTFETLQQITLDFFGENIFAEFRENGITSTITYQQMYAKANDVRNNLLIKHRDKDGVVILKMENSPNWYIAF
jgi:long-subunit acyl-CoA synthetase (AMP-forming)